jgi:hypothetical protein
VTFLVVAFILPQTLAITNQGLFYRMDDGNRFYYTWELSKHDVLTTSEIIYIEIENASKPIPDPLTYLDDLDHIDIHISYENDTSMGFEILIFLYMEFFAFPVGNWSLITSLATADLSGLLPAGSWDVDMRQDSEIWGFSYKIDDSDTAQVDVWVEYSKFDGMMSYFYFDYWNTTTSESINEYEVTRFSYHNLHWGFNDGDRFDFHLSMVGSDFGFSDVDEDFYLTVADDGIPIVPYNISEWDGIPFIMGDLYWSVNDTEFYDPVFNRSWRIAVPIGNWSLLDDFIGDITNPTNLSLDESGSWFWGYSWSADVDDTHYQVHTDYLKIDGFIATHSVVVKNTTTSEVIGTVTITRDGIEPLYDTTAPLINHPSDMQFVEGTENHNITWTPTDDYPGDFEITVNGVVMDLGSWASLSTIVLDLDDFNEGEYTCTITVYDVAGNSATDTVMVNVTEASTIPTGSLTDLLFDNILYIAIGVGAVAAIGTIVRIRRKS